MGLPVTLEGTAVCTSSSKHSAGAEDLLCPGLRPSTSTRRFLNTPPGGQTGASYCGCVLRLKESGVRWKPAGALCASPLSWAVASEAGRDLLLVVGSVLHSGEDHMKQFELMNDRGAGVLPLLD